MQAFVPKNRRPKFELTLKIIDLNNVPLVCGASYVKWHLPSSTSAEHRGRTDKAIIMEHKAVWEYEKKLPIRLTVGRKQYLQDSEIHFEILQDYSTGGRGDRIHLGNVKLNLAEYVNRNDEDEDGITRRYLMQDSKINSTLRIGILMKQTEGDRDFIAPPLKTAMVFGGIAGIMSAEAGDPDESGHLPSISSKTRELSELQDMYRRSLAASWACQTGELAPDKLVEDIFAGGDGGSMRPPPRPGSSRGDVGDDSASVSDSIDSRQTINPNNLSPISAEKRRPERTWSGHQRNQSKSLHHTSASSNTSNVSGRGSIEQQVHHGKAEKMRRSYKPAPEVSEFDVHDDLRSWAISARG